MKSTSTHNPPLAAPDDPHEEKRTSGPSAYPNVHLPDTSRESPIKPPGDTDSIFQHAPVSLWEEDFSEVKIRFDELRRGGVEDLRKHFKKNPEEVFSLARMVRIVRVNERTLELYDAEGLIEFQEGLSQIFNKESFEIFKEELMALWKGRTSFTSEAINLTLSGASKSILIRLIIPPGFERTWARVYVAITDITAIKENMRNLQIAEQKYRSVFNAVKPAVLLADAQSGLIIEANTSAKQLFGASEGELVGMHLADLVNAEEQKRVRGLMSDQIEKNGLTGQIIHVRNKSNGNISVVAEATLIESGNTTVIVVSLTPAEERTPASGFKRKTSVSEASPDKRLTPREREILGLICSGKTSRSIAQRLSISEKTVETHRTRIMQKLDTHCVVDLVKYAVTNGLARLQ